MRKKFIIRPDPNFVLLPFCLFCYPVLTMNYKHYHGILALVVVFLVVGATIVFLRPEANKYSDQNLRTYIDKGLSPEIQTEFDLRIATQKASIDAKEEFNGHDYLLLGNLYYQTGELALARDAYQAILDKNPDDVGALDNMGVTLEQMGDYLGAERMWMHSLELSGSVTNVLRLVDLIDQHLPEQEERLGNVLELSIKSLGQDELLNGRLAKWYFDHGEYEKAQSHYEVSETLSGRTGKYTDRIAEARRLSIESK